MYLHSQNAQASLTDKSNKISQTESAQLKGFILLKMSSSVINLIM